MAIKKYFSLPREPEFEFCHKIQVEVISVQSFYVGRSYCKGYSKHILSPTDMIGDIA